MTFDPKIPCNDLPPLPPGVDVETKKILKETIAARSGLAELKGPGATIPNQALLVDSLILQEAKASSEKWLLSPPASGHREGLVGTVDSLHAEGRQRYRRIHP